MCNVTTPVAGAGANALSRFAFSPLSRGRMETGEGRRRGTIDVFHARVVDRKREKPRRRRENARTDGADASRSFSDSLFVAEKPRREYGIGRPRKERRGGRTFSKAAAPGRAAPRVIGRQLNGGSLPGFPLDEKPRRASVSTDLTSLCYYANLLH